MKLNGPELCCGVALGAIAMGVMAWAVHSSHDAIDKMDRVPTAKLPAGPPPRQVMREGREAQTKIALCVILMVVVIACVLALGFYGGEF